MAAVLRSYVRKCLSSAIIFNDIKHSKQGCCLAQPALLVVLKRMAGHSKWANIKFKKGHSDVARSKVFGRLTLEIITAVREGGAELNTQLDNVITRARAVSMPKSSIEHAIKSGLGNKDNPMSEMILEARGPGGCGLLIEVLTSNKVRSKIDVNTILKRNGGIMKEGGTVQFQYENKGVVTIEDYLHPGKSDGEEISESLQNENFEKVEEIAIETGAEYVYFTQLDDGKRVIKFVCPVKETKKLSEDIVSLESKATIQSTGIEFFPKILTNLTEPQMVQADKLIDLLLNNTEVIRLYDNINDYSSSTCKLFVDKLAV